MDVTTLYHYCSPEAFISIIENRSIWLSSLSLSNDSAEGAVFHELLQQVYENDSRSHSEFSRIVSVLSSARHSIPTLGFCLSSEGDLLSQWRGYGNNGMGFSIGFNSIELRRLLDDEKLIPSLTTFSKIEYDMTKQLDLVRPIYEIVIDSLIDRVPTAGKLLGGVPPGFDYERDLEEGIAAVMIDLINHLPLAYTLKGNAFQEEREHRIISSFSTKNDSSIKHRADGNRIKPYIEISLPRNVPIVNEVILGPANATPPEVLIGMLRRAGFQDVRVNNSKATYVS